MKGIERVSAIDVSAPRMAQRLPDVPNQVIRLMRLMRAANHSLSTYLDLILRPIEFTESTLHTLLLIFSSDGGEVAPGALCELLGLTKANMTRILSVLDHKRFICRFTDSSDGRRQIVRITADGRRFVTNTLPRLSGPISMAVEDMTEEELSVLDGLLRRFVKSLDVGERIIRASV